MLPPILHKYPGLKVTLEGQQRDRMESIQSLFIGFAMAMLAIYAMLAIPFRSYIQPLIVMSAVPFGMVGAIWGHVIMGMSLSILSFIGMVALTGVVVNRRGVPLSDVDVVSSPVGQFAP